MKKYLLFDLDGTLTDPKAGITACAQYALACFGIDEPDTRRLEPFIGPPLRDSFMEFYDMSAEQAQEAAEKFRERFQDIGLFENEVYDGIPRMLRNLQSRGKILAVASSKPQVFVEHILDHFDLRKYFTVIVGSELDGRRESKVEVVREALDRLFAGKPIQRDAVYMIGDRKYDVAGAKALQVESVGVAYGYGGMEELKDAKADYIVRSVGELEKFLLRGSDEEESGRQKGAAYWSIKTMLWAFTVFMLARLLAEYAVPLVGGTGAAATAAGFTAGGAVLWRTARRLISRTAEETKLCHLKKKRPIDYLLLALAATGEALGLNLLLELTMFTVNSDAYRQVAESQYSVPFLVGLIVYGILSPAAEELLFRGVIHNCLRRVVPSAPALAMSSAWFGLYHLNPVQGIYGFLMGCLIGYAYEYFGDFRVAVAVHMGANLLVYCLSRAGMAVSGAVSWVVCAILLIFAAGALWMLNRQKKVF